MEEEIKTLETERCENIDIYRVYLYILKKDK